MRQILHTGPVVTTRARTGLLQPVSLLLLILPINAFAICISPTITPRECNFKNEDTALWLYQPPLKWTADEKLFESIESANEFALQYLNGVKTTGDAAIRYLHAGKAAAQANLAVLQAVRGAAAAASNDPLQLKTLYTDRLCEAFYSAAEESSGIRTGACDFDWLALPETLAQNQAVVERIHAILMNPSLVLGQEWGDVVDDVNRVRAEYNGLETMAANLTADALAEQLAAKFRSFEAMLQAPMTNDQHRSQVRSLIDLTRAHTTRDVLMATQANAKNLFGATAIDPADLAQYRSDLDESRGLKTKTETAIGRLQSMELNNMAKSLQGQVWFDVLEQQRALGFLTGLDKQAELEQHNQDTSVWYDWTRELHPPQTRLQPNDGVPLGFR